MNEKKKESEFKVGWVEAILIAVLVFVVVATVVALLGDKITLLIPTFLEWIRGIFSGPVVG